MIYSHQWNISSMTSQCHIVRYKNVYPLYFMFYQQMSTASLILFRGPIVIFGISYLLNFMNRKKSFSQKSNILFIVLLVPIGKYQDWLILFHIPVVKYQWLINFISHPCRLISVTNIPLGKYQPLILIFQITLGKYQWLIRDISYPCRQISVTPSWYFISL